MNDNPVNKLSRATYSIRNARHKGFVRKSSRGALAPGHETGVHGGPYAVAGCVATRTSR